MSREPLRDRRNRATTGMISGAANAAEGRTVRTRPTPLTHRSDITGQEG